MLDIDTIICKILDISLSPFELNVMLLTILVGDTTYFVSLANKPHQ